MKRYILVAIALMVVGGAFAQSEVIQSQQPQKMRTVTGIVKDTAGAIVHGAVVKLTATNDTISTMTNLEGLFTFANVKNTSFVLTVFSVGYGSFIMKFNFDTSSKSIATDPIVLKTLPIQNNFGIPIVGKPTIIYKPDTILYLTDKYKVAKNSKVDQLLKIMEGFNITEDGIVTHMGQQVKKFKINGKIYDSLKLSTTIKKIPVNAVANIEMIDDYNNLLSQNHWKSEPDKLLNINLKENNITDVNNLLGLHPFKRSGKNIRTLDDLLKEMEGVEVDAEGNLMHKGKPITKIIRHDGVHIDTLKYDNYTTATPKVTIIRFDCRDVITEEIANALRLVNTNTPSAPDVDDYGDQIPHFLIKPTPGSYISRATKY